MLNFQVSAICPLISPFSSFCDIICASVYCPYAWYSVMLCFLKKEIVRYCHLTPHFPHSAVSNFTQQTIHPCILTAKTPVWPLSILWPKLWSKGIDRAADKQKYQCPRTEGQPLCNSQECTLVSKGLSHASLCMDCILYWICTLVTVPVGAVFWENGSVFHPVTQFLVVVSLKYYKRSGEPNIQIWRGMDMNSSWLN